MQKRAAGIARVFTSKDRGRCLGITTEKLSKIAISFKACMQVGPAEVDCRAGESACAVHPKVRELFANPRCQAKRVF